MNCRPAAVWKVESIWERSKVCVAVCPFTVQDSVSLLRLNGSPGTLSTAERLLLADIVSPEGIRVCSEVTMGDCDPNRGSEPKVVVTTLPSGRVTVCWPFGAIADCAVDPSGPVNSRNLPPAAGYCTANCEVSPAPVVMVTDSKPGPAARCRLLKPPAASVSNASLPSLEYW